MPFTSKLASNEYANNGINAKLSCIADNIRLNSDLEENKLKNMEFYQEREKLNKTLEHYKRMNKVNFKSF